MSEPHVYQSLNDVEIRRTAEDNCKKKGFSAIAANLFRKYINSESKGKQTEDKCIADYINTAIQTDRQQLLDTKFTKFTEFAENNNIKTDIASKGLQSFSKPIVLYQKTRGIIEELGLFYGMFVDTKKADPDLGKQFFL